MYEIIRGPGGLTLSIKLMTRAWETDLKANLKLTYLCFCDYANDEGLCWPALDTVAEKIGVTRRTVRRHKRDLVEAGLMEVVEDSFDDFDTPLYKVTPPEKQPEGGGQRCPGGEDNAVRGGEDNAVRGDRTTLSPKPSTNHQEDPLETQSVREVFEHWVEQDVTISPRSLKSAIRKHIEARLEDYTPEELKQSISTYAEVAGRDDTWWSYDSFTLGEFMKRGEGKQVARFLEKSVDHFLEDDARRSVSLPAPGGMGDRPSSYWRKALPDYWCDGPNPGTNYVETVRRVQDKCGVSPDRAVKLLEEFFAAGHEDVAERFMEWYKKQNYRGASDE